MVYGRTVGGRTLDLEPSGSLLSASLVMRDRQTDSWWSIMASKAIGGPLAGTALPELPVGQKALWKSWRAEHPDTLVLSVAGAEHVASSPYDSYFGTDRTYRNLRPEDDRLPAKEPIFALQVDGQPWAVPHKGLGGGRVLEIPGHPRLLLLYRPPGAQVYASTEAWWVEPSQAGKRPAAGALRAAAASGRPGFARAEGFDTFWYTWVGVHPKTRLPGK